MKWRCKRMASSSWFPLSVVPSSEGSAACLSRRCLGMIGRDVGQNEKSTTSLEEEEGGGRRRRVKKRACSTKEHERALRERGREVLMRRRSEENGRSRERCGAGCDERTEGRKGRTLPPVRANAPQSAGQNLAGCDRIHVPHTYPTRTPCVPRSAELLRRGLRIGLFACSPACLLACSSMMMAPTTTIRTPLARVVVAVVMVVLATSCMTVHGAPTPDYGALRG